MAKKDSKTVFVRWVRSSIGFSYHQKRMVRSLGLRHLNQMVELQDTPSVRGLVARIPHLVEIVNPEAKPAWISTPEYSIRPGEVRAKRAPKKAKSEGVQSEAHSSEAPETPSENAEGKE